MEIFIIKARYPNFRLSLDRLFILFNFSENSLAPFLLMLEKLLVLVKWKLRYSEIQLVGLV